MADDFKEIKLPKKLSDMLNNEKFDSVVEFLKEEKFDSVVEFLKEEFSAEHIQIIHTQEDLENLTLELFILKKI